MKVKVLMLLLGMFLAQGVDAQAYHLALRIGYSQSQMRSSNATAPSLSSRNALQVALVHTHQPYARKLGFSVETGYLLKGARVESEALDYRLQFLSMPVLLDLYPIERLKVGIGPEVNYLLNGRNHVNDGTSFTLLNTYTNRWELAGVISTSYEISYYAQLGMRYSRGLNTLANSDINLGRNRIRTSSLQFFLYLKLAN